MASAAAGRARGDDSSAYPVAGKPSERRYEKAIEGKASPRHTGSRAGREQWCCIVTSRYPPYRTYGRRLPVTHVTSIGLDVHARSVSACAFDPFTGEVVQRSFGTDAGEDRRLDQGVRGAQGGLRERADRLRPLPPAQGAGRRLRRRRGVEDAEAAAEKRRKNDRRDAAFLARLLATRNVVEVWVPPAEAEAARDPVAGARRRARGPAARTAAALQVPAPPRPRLRRDRRARPQARRLDARVLALGRGAQASRAPPRPSAFDHYVTCVRCAESDKRAPREAGGRGGPLRAVGRRRRRAVVHQGDRRRHRVLPGRRGGLLQQVPDRRGVRVVARPHAIGALQRREGGDRRHHQDRQLGLQARASSRRRGTTRRARRGPRRPPPATRCPRGSRAGPTTRPPGSRAATRL